MALSQADYPVLQSQPVPVRFASFESDTVALGRAGWKLAMERFDDMRNPFEPMIRVVLHHPKLALSMMGRLLGADRLMHDRHRVFPNHYFRGDYGRGDTGTSAPFIDIESAGTKGQFNVTMMGRGAFPAMSWRDTEPLFREVQTSRELHTLPLFAELEAAKPETQELIVDPACVQSMLDQILKLQGAERRDIRARDSRRAREQGDEAPRPRQIHAQIISLQAA